MEKLLKIAYPVSTVAFGGVETFVKQTALFHDPKRIKPIYLFLKDGPLVEWMRVNTQHEIRVCPFQVRLRNLTSVIKAILWLKRESKFFSAQMMHSSMAYTALFGSVAAKLAGIQHVWFQHGPVGGWMDQIAGLLPSQAIIYNSKYTLQCQSSAMGLWSTLQKWMMPKLLHRVILLGGTSLPTQHVKDSGTTHVGILCRFQKWKGLELFIDAVKLVHRKIGHEKIKFTIWGDAIPGQENMEYAEKIENLARENFILRKPHTPKPELAIQTLDIMVNASIVPEPFGLTIVEAMNAGVIPIAPKWGGPLEIIEDQVTGLFFKPLSAESLSDKIIELTSDPETRIRLSQNAKTISLEKFSASKTISRIEDLYFELLGANCQERVTPELST